MRIPIELAETLAAVVDEGTLDAAARRLHVTPSAVSQRIKALEEQLGRVVLVRSKPVRADRGRCGRRPARPAGRAARARRAREPRAPATTRARSSRWRSRSTPIRWPRGSSSRSRGLAERHPVVFELHRDDQDFTAGLLESGTVMGAVTSRATPVAGCRVSPLGTMRYEAVATPEVSSRAGCRTGARRDALGATHPSWTSIAATICRRAG